MKTSNSGFSLVEVMISSAILGAVMLMAYAVLNSSTHLATQGSNLSELEQRGGRLFTLLHDDMSAAVFTTPSTGTPWYPAVSLGIPAAFNNTAIIYQVNGPATATPTGTSNAPGVTTTVGYTVPNNYVVTSSGKSITYTYNGSGIVASFLGSPSSQIDSNLACLLRFEADTILMESATTAPNTANQYPDTWWQTYFHYPTNLSQLLPFAYPTLAMPTSNPSLKWQILNIDVNNNGSMTDMFVQGKIMKYVVDTFGNIQSTEKLDGEVILRVNPVGGTFDGDVDGDGQADPLFCFTDATGTPILGQTGTASQGILVNVWHGRLDDSGKHFILKNSRILYHFRS